MSEIEEYMFKIVIIGSAGVGKTSLVHYFLTKNFNKNVT